MNCQAAQKLLSAERDGALGTTERAALASHVEQCAACASVRVMLSESAAAWRETTAAVKAPDAKMEWEKLRRKLDGGAVAARARPRAMWWTASLAAAAAVAIAFVMLQNGVGGTTAKSRHAQMARADSVEVGGDASSAMVYVDDKSGWLVVWAPSDKDKG